MRWWMKLIAALVAIALLLWLGWSMVGGFLKVFNGAALNDSEPDPMFAREAELPTCPPELDEEQAAPDHPTLDDYVMEEGAPVDKTADELIREAQEKADS